MLRNFAAMPLFLKLITLFGLLMLGFGINTLVPFGELPGVAWPMTYSEWWSSGQGPIYFAKTVGLGATCLLFLLRVGRARLAHLVVVGAIMAEVSIEASRTDEVVVHGAMFAAGASYLYLSSSVRAYFQGRDGSGQASEPERLGRLPDEH